MHDTRVGSSGCIGYVVVALGGELDATIPAGTARILQAAVTPQLRIIVDLAKVTFMDCGSVRKLLCSPDAKPSERAVPCYSRRPSP